MLRRVSAIVLAAVAAVGLLLTIGSAATAAPTHKGQTLLRLHPDAAAALGSLGVEVGLLAPGYVSGDALAMPVTGRYPAPVVKHVGGLGLTAGATTVTLTNFWIDTTSGQVSGIVNESVRLDLFAITAGPSAGTVTLVLTAGAAAALDAAFSVSAFEAGMPIAYATPQPRAAGA